MIIHIFLFDESRKNKISWHKKRWYKFSCWITIKKKGHRSNFDISVVFTFPGHFIAFRLSVFFFFFNSSLESAHTSKASFNLVIYAIVESFTRTDRKYTWIRIYFSVIFISENIHNWFAICVRFNAGCQWIEHIDKTNINFKHMPTYFGSCRSIRSNSFDMLNSMTYTVCMYYTHTHTVSQQWIFILCNNLIRCLSRFLIWIFFISIQIEIFENCFPFFFSALRKLFYHQFNIRKRLRFVWIAVHTHIHTLNNMKSLQFKMDRNRYEIAMNWFFFFAADFSAFHCKAHEFDFIEWNSGMEKKKIVP